MGEHDHKTLKCENCGEVYCPECDFVAEMQEVARLKPGLCGSCLESSSYFFDRMRARYGDATCQ
jgi:hypothetical protein